MPNNQLSVFFVYRRNYVSIISLLIFMFLNSLIIDAKEKDKKALPVKFVISSKVQDKLVSVPTNHVTIEGEIGRRINVTINNNVKNLKLTEFPDPGSQFIYFKIPDYSIEINDELIIETSEVQNWFSN